MAVWYIVVLYLVVFGVLQFVVYRYLRGRDGGAASTAGSPSSQDAGGFDDPRADLGSRPEDPSAEADRGGAETPREEPERRPGEVADEDGTRRCPHCGATNEASSVFTYCRNCAHQLGP